MNQFLFWAVFAVLVPNIWIAITRLPRNKDKDIQIYFFIALMILCFLISQLKGSEQSFVVNLLEALPAGGMLAMLELLFVIPKWESLWEKVRKSDNGESE
jgi:hypothetical protein